jgi:hypothetical protein
MFYGKRGSIGERKASMNEALHLLNEISERTIREHGSYSRCLGFYETILSFVAEGLIKPENIVSILESKLEELKAQNVDAEKSV